MKKNVVFWIIILVLLRLLIVCVTKHTTISGDEGVYTSAGIELSENIQNFLKNGFSDEQTLWDKFLAINNVYFTKFPVTMYWVAFHHLIAAENYKLTLAIANAFLSGIIGLLLYILGSKMGDQRIGILATIFFVFYPDNLGYFLLAMSEFLFGFFLILSIYLLHFYFERRNLLLVPLLGIVWGLGTLTRSPLLYCIIIIPFWLTIQDKTQWKRHLAVFFITLIFCIITILPWTLRNYSVYGVFVPLDTESSGIILGGFLKSKPKIDPRIPIPTVVEDINPGEGYIKETGMLKKYILTHPFEILSAVPKNICTFLEPDEEIFRRIMSNDLFKFRINRVMGYLYAIAAWFFYAVVLFSAIFGMLWAPRNSLKDLLILFLVFFTLLHTICSAVGRHHTPIMTFLFIFSAWFFCNIRDFKMFFKKRWLSYAFVSLLFLFFSLLWIFQLINIKL